MQLRGLVRFFTILLIIYSVYQLSFTWVVRGHERKMESQAKEFVAINYGNADSATQARMYSERLKRLIDSTKDVTVHYGPTGAISYQKAKENELNLGLDLQGGINVTLEVELSGLLRAMTNNSQDPAFVQALESANRRRAASNADYISLFVEEFRRLNPNGRLAPLFATPGQENIRVSDNDGAVISAIRSEANDAFERTFRVLSSRIDQFGVAQPNINPDAERGIITVELPGVQDQERVRRYLQSSANLQFWEVYNISEIGSGIQGADDAFNALMGGTQATRDTARTTTEGDTTARTSDTAGLADLTDTTARGDDLQRQTLMNYIQFNVTQQGQGIDNGIIGYVLLRDTGVVRTYLQNPAIARNFPGDVSWMYGVVESRQNQRSNFVALYGIKTKGREKARLEGEAIIDARSDFNPTTGQPEVSMRMNQTAAREWARMTGENKGRSIAIVLDNIVYSAPRVNDVIEGGSSSISGGFSPQEATDLANILKAGKLPAPAKIVQEQVVGPTLGQDAIRGGMMAFIISFLVIFLLMLIYYNTSGWIANIALTLNMLFTIGVLTGLGATLTAPGIAGLVLTIGMAVDTNVIIFERIKEELTRGKSYAAAVTDGYRRSLPPVLDAHITTLMTAIILFSFGLGPVKGFATTQIIGLLLSLFCGILVSRWVTSWFTSKKRHLEYFTGVSRKVLQKTKYKFIEYRKYAYITSAVILLLGIGAFINGFDQGVEFMGGRSYIVQFEGRPDVESVRRDLTTALNDNPVIKTIGDPNRLDITTAFMIAESGPQVDSVVQIRLMEGLSNHLPAGMNYATFTNEHLLGSTKVLPTISDDLKRGAMWATFWSLLIITIYIFIRFRDWRYSLGTIAALLHDVLVTLIVFSFARAIVPFPLEIGQHFIAAILTVIGFSMNDTIIIFDRIREFSKEMKGATKEVVINKAINETLSRTVMTSLTVFITILILFLVGGEVTRGFAFAMLIGVVTGTYSSVFVAAPILVDLGGKRPLGGKDLPTEERTTKVSPVTAR